jgi:hypothetical protein
MLSVLPKKGKKEKKKKKRKKKTKEKNMWLWFSSSALHKTHTTIS